MAGHILVAEDQEILREFIARGLREAGFLVRQTGSNADALDLARTFDFDVWVLDRNLPDGDSIASLIELRREGRTTPALFLTASVAIEQRVKGLNAGADDYLSKPFSIDELTARLRALIRRPAIVQSSILRCGPIELHFNLNQILVANKVVETTANEWRLLTLLARAPGIVFDRRQIMESVGITESSDDVAVDHLISRLRTKLRAQGVEGVIRTVRGIGFTWSAPNDVT